MLTLLKDIWNTACVLSSWVIASSYNIGMPWVFPVLGTMLSSSSRANWFLFPSNITNYGELSVLPKKGEQSLRKAWEELEDTPLANGVTGTSTGRRSWSVLCLSLFYTGVEIFKEEANHWLPLQSIRSGDVPFSCVMFQITAAGSADSSTLWPRPSCLRIPAFLIYFVSNTCPACQVLTQFILLPLTLHCIIPHSFTTFSPATNIVISSSSSFMPYDSFWMSLCIF